MSAGPTIPGDALSAAVSIEKVKPRIDPPVATLRSLGVAIPEIQRDQTDIGEGMAEVWGLSGAALSRWRRLVANTDIDHRAAVLPFEKTVAMSTRERMEAYERLAPDLAAAAAASAIERAGIDARDITDLIIVSCTGFSAPGVDVGLALRMGMRRDIRRTIVGFMGCFGAICGLRAARGACAAEPGAVALVVCIELCSLHMRSNSGMDSQVASALFADGAAAAVVVGSDHSENPCHRPSSSTVGALQCRSTDRSEQRSAARGIGRITAGAGLIIPEGADWMTWRITDAGFAMTLTRDVPPAIRERIGDFLEAGRRSGEAPARSVIVHPGGPGVLDAVEDALNLRGDPSLDAAREILRRHGNMSSATIFFVLDEALRRGAELPATLLAFGPGLTMERLSIV